MSAVQEVSRWSVCHNFLKREVTLASLRSGHLLNLNILPNIDKRKYVQFVLRRIKTSVSVTKKQIIGRTYTGTDIVSFRDAKKRETSYAITFNGVKKSSIRRNWFNLFS